MDISNAVWNETDSANTAAAPDGSAEGMAPSGVNNVLRAHQGAIKRNWKRNSVMVTTGAAGAYLVTHTVPPTALADGETELVQWHVANSAGATLNVGALGAKPLHYYSSGAWRLIPAGLIGIEQTLRVAYHSTSGAYRILDIDDRTGVIEAFAGSTAPSGSLFCFGQAISRTAYAGLFAALSTDHGVGDGSATFNLPDLRGRVAAGKSNMGGSDAGTLTGGTTLGAGLGAQTHTLTTAELALHAHSHSHGMLGNYLNVNGVGSGVAGGLGTGSPVWENTTTGADATGAGSNAAHNNVQPTRVLNYVIRI